MTRSLLSWKVGMNGLLSLKVAKRCSPAWRVHPRCCPGLSSALHTQRIGMWSVWVFSPGDMLWWWEGLRCGREGSTELLRCLGLWSNTEHHCCQAWPRFALRLWAEEKKKREEKRNCRRTEGVRYESLQMSVSDTMFRVGWDGTSFSCHELASAVCLLLVP